MSVIDYSIFYNYAPPYANKVEPDFVCFFYPLFTGMKKDNPNELPFMSSCK